MKAPTIAIVALLSGCATADRVQALEEKVVTLEKEVEELKKAPPAKTAKANAKDTAKEKEAAALYREVQKALKAGEIDQAKEKINEMGKKYKDTRLWRRASRTQAELNIIGKDAPKELANVEWYQGETDIGSGTTLVVFWEVWCPHCKKEVPSLEKRYQSLKGKGLKIAALTKLSRNTEPQKVKDFISDSKVTYPVGKEDGTLSSTFAVSGIPAAAVVKDGKIVWRGHPSSLSDEKLESWL